jgi:hypothetical protein
MSGAGKDLTVVGVIEIDGKTHRVALPLPLLVQDGFLYLGTLAARYFEEAEKSKASAAALRTLGENILSGAAGNISKTGCGLADLRLAVLPLVVYGSAFDSWKRALFKVSTRASREDRLSFRISSTGFEVCPALFWLGEYTSACDFSISRKLVAPKTLLAV